MLLLLILQSVTIFRILYIVHLAWLFWPCINKRDDDDDDDKDGSAGKPWKSIYNTTADKL